MTARKLPAAARRRHKGHLDHEGHFDRGAAAVEMALVMPLLILMVMGIIDFGRIFNGEIQLSQAAREGARVAALGFSTGDVISRTGAALNNPAFQGSLSFGSTGLVSGCALTTGCILVDVVTTNASGTFTSVRPGGTCNSASAADAAANYGQVTITVPYTKILFGPGSLEQKAVMKCSG